MIDDRFSFRHAVLLGLTLALFGNSGLVAAEPVSPLTPEQAIQSMQLDPGLSIELVASEPMVQDPVAICWDAHGAMYVAEMGDYPALPTGGRIKRLVDTDGDGRMDQMTLFAADVAYPTSVLPYRDGLLVSAAPDILWLKDIDGDGIADQRQRLLTGFGEGNQQLRVNGLVRGLDGWIYGANGRSDGEIGFVGEDGKLAGTPVSIRSTDFRFDPDRKLVETAGGFTQFGQGFDDYGNRFISWNTVHIRHVVMEQRYLARNPNAPVTATAQELSDAGSTPRLFPISQTTKRFNAETPGFFNASCGLTIFRGDALGSEYRGNAFACEPLSNVVHRDVLKPAGASFIASRPDNEQDREFLASTDSWFRPVNLATGPDGALHVVDFYRRWVEHPQWVANAEARQTVDWAEGHEYGRIYRIVPKSAPTSPPPHPRDLAALDSPALVELLAHPNAWQRETASRLLMERSDRQIVPALRDLVRQGTEWARLHAISVLHVMGQLSRDDSSVIARDSSPAVRRLAFELVSRTDDEWVSHLQDGACSDSAALRFQVACTLGDIPSDRIAPILVELFLRDGNDPWMQQAIFSSVAGRVGPFMQSIVQRNFRELSESQMRWLTAVIRSEPVLDQTQWTSYAATLNGADDPDGRAFWTGLIALGCREPVRGRTSARALRYAITTPNVHANLKLVAIAVQQYASPKDAIPTLKPLLAADQSLDIQQWAVEAAFAMPGLEAADLLCGSYPSMTPSVQRIVLDHLISHQSRVERLVAALENRVIPASHIDVSQRGLLASRLDEETRTRLSELWTPPSNESKNELIGRYATGLNEASDLTKGKQLFQQHCRTCHMRQGDGNRVGPDLTGVAGRSPTDILADVLDPNRSVSVDGRSYTLVTKDGVVISGIIAGETATSVTLKKPGGILESVLRSDIEQLQFTGKSLMPEGFDQLLSPADLANLIAFLKDAGAK